MIGDSYKKNFDTLREAAANGDLCLLEVYDRITGEPHVALCAGYLDEEEMANLIPLAMMFDRNPYDIYVTEKEDVALYEGVVEADGEHRVICLSPRGLLPCYSDIINHSPDGFNWGYGGSGPAQLALALLAHRFEQTSGRDHARAQKLYQQLKDEVISKLPQDQGWSLSAPELDSWIHHAEHPEEDTDGTSDEAAGPTEAPADDA